MKQFNENWDGVSRNNILNEAEENVYKRAAAAWRRGPKVFGNKPELTLYIQTDIPQIPGATSYLDQDRLSIQAWVRQLGVGPLAPRSHALARVSNAHSNKPNTYEGYAAVRLGNTEEVTISIHSDDPKRSFRRYAPYEGEAIKMCEDFIEKAINEIIKSKPELGKFLVNWRRSGSTLPVGQPYLR